MSIIPSPHQSQSQGTIGTGWSPKAAERFSEELVEWARETCTKCPASSVHTRNDDRPAPPPSESLTIRCQAGGECGLHRATQTMWIKRITNNLLKCCDTDGGRWDERPEGEQRGRREADERKGREVWRRCVLGLVSLSTSPQGPRGEKYPSNNAEHTNGKVSNIWRMLGGFPVEVSRTLQSRNIAINFGRKSSFFGPFLSEVNYDGQEMTDKTLSVRVFFFGINFPEQ
ncbi:hypothetical protein B0H11DRAFT_1911352 [Mycena galericulata]|nr:hypothetical protein B0H11DRAFT_1911352 [Mycena galericulata]